MQKAPYFSKIWRFLFGKNNPRPISNTFDALSVLVVKYCKALFWSGGEP